MPVLTSDAFALSETVVAPEMKVGGRPGSDGYVNDYVERAIGLLSNRESLGRLGRESQKAIRGRYSWDQVAAEWERIFDLNLRARNNQICLMERASDARAN